VTIFDFLFGKAGLVRLWNQPEIGIQKSAIDPSLAGCYFELGGPEDAAFLQNAGLEGAYLLPGFHPFQGCALRWYASPALGRGGRECGLSVSVKRRAAGMSREGFRTRFSTDGHEMGIWGCFLTKTHDLSGNTLTPQAL
jgi:hypothetical protein